MNLRGAASAVSQAQATGRARIIKTPLGVTIIDDRYNSSPASLNGALQMLAGLPGRRIALLGRMAELAEFEEAEHRAAGSTAAASCDILVCSGETCRPIAGSAREAGHADVRWFETKDEAGAEVGRSLQPGDYVLVKASRGEAFETILHYLEDAR
jgi:UDP-N-acetylmuramoyl-tripeptide--D-alanyl-D-alanine ligase